MHAPAQALHARSGSGPEPAVQPVDPAAEIVFRGDDEFGGRRRRGRPQIGDEVGDRDVGLVSDGGNHRHGRSGDRARHDLLVEGPEIFDGAATAADNDHVDARHAADRAQPARDVERRAFTLNPRGPDNQMRVRIPPAQHVDDVANGGAVERGDDADLARQRRERPLAALVEQPFVLEPLL